jgi:hypothetical protein
LIDYYCIPERLKVRPIVKVKNKPEPEWELLYQVPIEVAFLKGHDLSGELPSVMGKNSACGNGDSF